MDRTPVQIVWIKRDLRLHDHVPLAFAAKNHLPTLLLFCFEPSQIASAESDDRHWRFVYQSLTVMNKQLEHFKTSVYLSTKEVHQTLLHLSKEFIIINILSYRETGLRLTYERDMELSLFLKKEKIKWIEFPYSGVQRGINNRKHWSKNWHEAMHSQQDYVELSKINFITKTVVADSFTPNFTKPDKRFQPGGESNGHQYLHTFLQERSKHYNKSISKPLASRTGCSRLSPYLAWGNLSNRQVYQATLKSIEHVPHSWQLKSFASRLHWRDHFIQKFEMEDRMEFENINRAFNILRTEWNEEHYQAWANGQTGYPLVDACMRCLHATGYINFRMRSMLISFLTHHLWLDWKKGAVHLAKLFLDFEPGIHYPQIQMQAGVTGINAIRIYNPVKQSLENDTKGEFIKLWVPEIAHLPLPFVHEPWKMTSIDQGLYKFDMGVDYPLPIVQIEKTYKRASFELHEMRKNVSTLKEANRILQKHTNENRMA
jgi:deoxyribodipyrimidine photo-lyase